MNFKAHLIGGIAAGCLMGAVSYCVLTPNLIFLSKLMLITTFFSLFPDLDISSITQRWFFRVIFVVLLYLAYTKHYQLATLIAILSVTPLLSRHRGWTHSIWAACLVPWAMAVGYDYFVHNHHALDFKQIIHAIRCHQWLAYACMLGWLTHIFIDSKILAQR